MNKIKAIIFDLDDTLYDNNPLTEIALKQAIEVMIKNGLKSSFEEAYDKIKQITKNEPKKDCFVEIVKFFGSFKEEIIKIGKEKYYNADFELITPFPGVIKLLESLKNNYKLLLLTSGSRTQQNKKIDVLGIRNYFDHIFIDELNKKDDIFSIILSLLNIDSEEILVVGDRIDQEIEIGNKLGMKTLRVLKGKFSILEPENFHQEPHYTISEIEELIEILHQKNKLKIITIGGGTGNSSILEGLKKYTDDITAIVNVTDTGRSSGKIRKEMNIIAPGDTRNCLISLANSEQLMCELFQYRFDNGNLDGYNFGNLFIATLAKITGSFEKAIQEASRILQLKGKVIPCTFDNVNICAELEDGTILDEEDKIIDRHNDKVFLRSPIKKVFHSPESKANESAIKEIKKAEIIVICPGSLFTSVISNLSTKGIPEAINESKAIKVYICNIMTQVSQTYKFRASDHIKKILDYIKLDYVIVNTKKPNKIILEEYEKENAFLVENDFEELEKLGVRIIAEDVLDESGKKLLWEKKDLLRHDPEKIGRVLIGLIQK